MTIDLERRTMLQAGAAALGGAMLPGTAQAQENSGGKVGYEFMVKDIVYQHHGGKERLARLYQPAGSGPFPAVLQVHGGAWNSKDRTDGQNTALDLAAAGIVVLSIEFRNAPEAPYPASVQDINYGVRWLKAHAGEFGSSADRVGAYGTSSGGHQILLAAMRPDDPRYRALPLAEAPDMDARLAFVISGWGVLFPLERYKLAKAQGKLDLVKSHDTFFGNEETQIEATPALAIERGEKVYLPPALVFQGTKDEWTPVELAERLAADYRSAGGIFDLELFDGERHTFVNEHPFAPNSVKAVEMVKTFIKKYGSQRHALR
ncbi:MAG: alpha/beta hydrolase [Xanthobacteraceae bacterium]